MTKDSKKDAGPDRFVDRSARAIRFGLITTLFLAVGLGTWATTAKLSGAVVTQGNVVVASNLKSVQHPDGGIVGDIRVQNGDRVAEGDVLLTLDDKIIRASRALVDDQLVALKVRLARLEAEQDGRDTMVLPPELAERADEPKVADVLASQRSVLVSARQSREGQVATYEEKISQLEEQITGLQEQRAATQEQVDLIEHELSGLLTLFEKGLTPETRITALKRERSALLGSRGSYASQIAVARGQISEARLAIMQLEKSFQEQVANQISAVLPEIGQLTERRAAADITLDRIEVRAPVDGIVHELATHTVGGVVQPGEQLMQIVPEADSLVVTAMVSPQDINNVRFGQDATLVIGAFDQKSVPRLDAKVAFVSADIKMDQATGMGYFEVRIGLDESAVAFLSERELALLPGMPAEVYILTGGKTMATYLLEPLSKQLRTTFRET